MKLLLLSGVILILQLTSNGLTEAQTTPFIRDCPSRDIVIVLDASGSICDSDPKYDYRWNETCDNWSYAVRFVYNIELGLDIGPGPYQDQVALVVFSSESTLYWDLNKYRNKTALLEATAALVYHKGGTTDLTGALNLTYTTIFNTSTNRPIPEDTVIIITDGFATIPETVEPVINAMHASGIRTLVVGITEKINDPMLKILSSPPHELNRTIFIANDYKSVTEAVLQQLEVAICIPDPVTAVPTTQKPLVKCDSILDLCFVIDASGSICDGAENYDYTYNTTCDNWKFNIQFISNIISDLEIGLDATRVGLVIFSNDAVLEWHLTTYTDIISLLYATNSLTYHGGGTTDLTGGLDIMRTQCFGFDDDRPNVPNTAIVITDGYPTVPSTVQAAIDAVNASGIRVFAVGVTDKVDVDTLRRVSSSPQQENVTYWVAENYQSVDKAVREKLVSEVCNNLTTNPDPIPGSTTTIPTNILTSEPRTLQSLPSTVECDNILDLCFVVDASGSICDGEENFDYTYNTTCDNWKFNLQFISNIISDMKIGWNVTRVGLVTFSNDAILQWHLTKHTDIISLLYATNSLIYHGGGTTDLTGGLDIMRTQCFGVDDDRPEVPNTAIVITDGYPTVPSTVQAAIDAVNASGIRVLAVGVTNKVDVRTLRRVSSPPQQENETYWVAENYQSVDRAVREKLVSKVCNNLTTNPDPIPGSTTTIPVNVPTDEPRTLQSPPPSVLCNNTMDVCFVVDASGSICDSDEGYDYRVNETCNNWIANLEFIHKIAAALTIGASATRIGVVTFSSEATVQFTLNKYSDSESLLKAIDSLVYHKGGTTDLTGGLELMRTQCFGSDGDRWDVPNTAIVITDGYPTNASTVQGAIDAVNASGIRVLAVGVTHKVDVDTLRRISSYPQQENVTYWIAENYQSLDAAVRDKIVTKACNDTIAPDPVPGSTSAITPDIQSQRPTQQTPPPSVLCNNTMDVCFVVDASGSICDSDEGYDYAVNDTCNNWKANLQFIHNIAAQLAIGPSSTRVGLVTFSSEAAVQFTVTQYTDKDSVLRAIDSLVYHKGGTTDLTGGLDLMRTECFGSNNDRLEVQNTAIVITDGYPTDPSTVQGAIDAVNANSIRVLAVGVTDKVDVTTIKKLSSYPHKINETYFLASDYSTVDAVRQQLVEKSCETSPTPN